MRLLYYAKRLHEKSYFHNDIITDQPIVIAGACNLPKKNINTLSSAKRAIIFHVSSKFSEKKMIWLATYKAAAYVTFKIHGKFFQSYSTRCSTAHRLST